MSQRVGKVQQKGGGVVAPKFKTSSIQDVDYFVTRGGADFQIFSNSYLISPLIRDPCPCRFVCRNHPFFTSFLGSRDSNQVETVSSFKSPYTINFRIDFSPNNPTRLQPQQNLMQVIFVRVWRGFLPPPPLHRQIGNIHDRIQQN